MLSFNYSVVESPVFLRALIALICGVLWNVMKQNVLLSQPLNPHLSLLLSPFLCLSVG